jgi:iron complex outermembrane receptor protein
MLLRRFLAAAAFGAAPALVLPLTAAAQEGGLEEVVVTAERREASLQEVPVAVTALTMESLEQRFVTEPQDLMRLVPSLKMNNNITSPTNLSPALRGSLQQDASLVVAESPFGIYVDDVFIPRLNGNNVALADIERIEVLRGPQGTLYGRNTLAGAIKFVTRTPGEDSWFDASIAAGNYDHVRAGFSMGGPMTDDWGGSLAVQFNTKDGQYFNNSTNQDAGLQDNGAARVKLAYNGGDKLDAVFSLSYSDSSGDSLLLVPGTTPNVPGNAQYTSDDVVPTFGNFQVGTPLRPGAQPAPITDLPSHQTEQTIASANISYEFDNFTLRSITGYVGLDDFFSTDFSGTGGGFTGASKIGSEVFTQEFQIQGVAMDDRLNYLVGLYYFDEGADQTFGWNLAGFPLSNSFIDTDVQSVSLFGQADYQISDNLKATFGARWVEDDKDFRLDFIHIPNFIVPVPLPVEQINLSNSYSEVTPRLGLDWSLDPGGNVDSMLLFASAARGFKSGGYSAIVLLPPATIAETPYFPETNWTYEVGIKTDLFDNKFRINANYYYSDVSDLTLNSTVLVNGQPTFPVTNAGDAVIQGLEFELTLVPNDYFTLFLSGATADGEFKNLNPSAAPAQAPASFGVQAQTPQTPDYTVTVGVDYSAETSFGNLGFGLDYYVTDDYVTAATNDFVVTSYHRLNGYVSLGFKDNWEVRLAARNLQDNADITSGARAFGAWIYLPPREFLLSLNYRM